jgi:hypothetical protein
VFSRGLHKGHHLNTPPIWETNRAQHCQAKRYSWAMENMTADNMDVFTLEAHEKGGFLSVSRYMIPRLRDRTPGMIPRLRDRTPGEEELFSLIVISDEIVALVAVGSIADGGRGFFLNHTDDELRFDEEFKDDNAYWILHKDAEGKVAFECNGVEKGKYLSHNGEEVCLQDGLPGDGAWWLQKPFDLRMIYNPISLCFRGRYLSHANGIVSTQSAVGAGEVFLLEKLSNGRVNLACTRGEKGKYLSHANFGLGLTDNRGEGEEWICHDHGNGVVAFEACGRESGKFLGIDVATVRLANSFRDNGHLWQLKQV